MWWVVCRAVLLGGALSGLLSRWRDRRLLLPAASSAGPPKPKAVPPLPQRVGGNVQQANLIKQPKPSYPPLAKAARVQGTVKFQATISKDGTIENLQLLSGPPLLGARRPCRRFSNGPIKPTLLNGEPVDVITTIDVNFYSQLVTPRPHGTESKRIYLNQLTGD